MHVQRPTFISNPQKHSYAIVRRRNFDILDSMEECKKLFGLAKFMTAVFRLGFKRPLRKGWSRILYMGEVQKLVGMRYHLLLNILSNLSSSAACFE